MHFACVGSKKERAGTEIASSEVHDAHYSKSDSLIQFFTQSWEAQTLPNWIPEFDSEEEEVLSFVHSMRTQDLEHIERGQTDRIAQRRGEIPWCFPKKSLYSFIFLHKKYLV